jgi:hypothetical protein
MVIEMKENKKRHNSSEEGFMELNQEDKEIYLFLRGGFAAK